MYETTLILTSIVIMVGTGIKNIQKHDLKQDSIKHYSMYAGTWKEKIRLDDSVLISVTPNMTNVERLYLSTNYRFAITELTVKK